MYVFFFVIAALNDYGIMASVIIITIRKSISCAALIQRHDFTGKGN